MYIEITIETSTSGRLKVISMWKGRYWNFTFLPVPYMPIVWQLTIEG